MQIGAQLYTIREFCQTPEALALSMKKVADLGYKNIQVSGTCAFDPQWLKEQLDSNGLKCVLTHTAQKRIVNETETVADEHDVFRCKFVGLGWYDFAAGDEAYQNFLKTFLPAAKKLNGRGKYFMYHNHAHEFKRLKDNLIIEKLFKDIPAELMGFTLDTYWIQHAGGDPAQWIEKFAGRIPCVHLKDYTFDQKMAVLGEGNINFDRVFEKAAAGGTEYLLVEQDDCYGEDPFECLRRSYEYLKSNGFE